MFSSFFLSIFKIKGCSQYFDIFLERVTHKVHADSDCGRVEGLRLLHLHLDHDLVPGVPPYGVPGEQLEKYQEEKYDDQCLG